MKTRRYFNRDLSWIDFNKRVLAEGLRRELPPVERFRYLSIAFSNFEEFFMIRVAGVKAARNAARKNNAFASEVRALNKQIHQVAEKIRSIFCHGYDCLQHEVFPALAQGGLELVRPDSYTEAEKVYLESFFIWNIYPILTPLRIEDERFSPIQNYDLYAAFLLTRKGEEAEFISVTQIPASLERILWLPDTVKTRWALLEDVVLTWGALCHLGYEAKERMFFKINRDADVSVDEQRDEDFIEAMEEAIEYRGRSRVVRMVYSPGSVRLRDELARRFELGEDDLYEVSGPLNLGGIRLADINGFDRMKEAPWDVYDNPAFVEGENFWQRINLSDVLLHFPYESFDPVLRFFQEAATDPQVIAIKATLYRTSGDSPIVRALEEAALNGKQVTVVVELKARFDEVRNISWAKGLEKAGVIVIYGLAGLKVHAKVAIVIRREHERIKRYVHLSTGNYNDGTARLYEDLGLFSAREEFALDAGLLFNMITGYSVIQSTRYLIIAPAALKRRLIELIERETQRSSQEYPGRIMAKMNALADPEIIDALYRASQSGVTIDLCVRGICMLVPGVAGMSEHIRVVSIVDHYLEHSRICYFANGGADELFLSSADWMPRNLERRVELMFPILQDDLKQRVRVILAAYFEDNTNAHELMSDGTWTPCSRRRGAEEKSFRVQTALLSLTRENAERPLAAREEFSVRRGQA
jgi:polyphosphate kinase